MDPSIGARSRRGEERWRAKNGAFATGRSIRLLPSEKHNGGGFSGRVCVYIMQARKTRRSEVKRADLLWQVAQGRRCPNRPPDCPPPGILSLHPVPSGSIQVCFSLALSFSMLLWPLCSPLPPPRPPPLFDLLLLLSLYPFL